MKNPIPYPLRATKLTLDFNPFGFWWRPVFARHRGCINEEAKRRGAKQWWFRWAWFQISYSRWR